MLRNDNATDITLKKDEAFVRPWSVSDMEMCIVTGESMSARVGKTLRAEGRPERRDRHSHRTTRGASRRHHLKCQHTNLNRLAMKFFPVYCTYRESDQINHWRFVCTWNSSFVSLGAATRLNFRTECYDKWTVAAHGLGQ